jgi:molybdopterin-guanine dinucleotide biosynthesis protein A
MAVEDRMPQRVGLVLAGGAGRRMGRTKGDLALQGKTLAERAGSTLWPVCGSVLVSVGVGMSNPARGYPSLVDPPPAGRGPLVGIDGAFEATGDADLLVLACDYPYVTTELLRELVGQAAEEDDLVMLTDFAGRDHPLVGLWRRSAAPVVRSAVDEKRHKVRGLLMDLTVRRLGPGQLAGWDLDRALLNLNSTEDLRALEARTAKGEGTRWAD